MSDFPVEHDDEVEQPAEAPPAPKPNTFADIRHLRSGAPDDTGKNLVFGSKAAELALKKLRQERGSEADGGPKSFREAKAMARAARAGVERAPAPRPDPRVVRAERERDEANKRAEDATNQVAAYVQALQAGYAPEADPYDAYGGQEATGGPDPYADPYGGREAAAGPHYATYDQLVTVADEADRIFQERDAARGERETSARVEKLTKSYAGLVDQSISKYRLPAEHAGIVRTALGSLEARALLNAGLSVEQLIDSTVKALSRDYRKIPNFKGTASRARGER